MLLGQFALQVACHHCWSLEKVQLQTHEQNSHKQTLPIASQRQQQTINQTHKPHMHKCSQAVSMHCTSMHWQSHQLPARCDTPFASQAPTSGKQLQELPPAWSVTAVASCLKMAMLLAMAARQHVFIAFYVCCLEGV
jgi:hypothetical protein